MRWATRAGVHIDRASSAWLIRRFLDPDAEFQFVSGPDEVADGSVPFDMRGVELGHHTGPNGQDCTFETLLRRHDLDDPVLWKIAEIIPRPTSTTNASTRPKPLGSIQRCAACPWSAPTGRS